jgi:hypothetical protein
LALASVTIAATFAPAVSAAMDLHAEYSALLKLYVTDDGVRYEAWSKTPADVRALSKYVDLLEGTSVRDMERDIALAYWINLYNAATLELVLSHYPVDSIKDTAGLMKSPWNKKLVKVEGADLTLNAIENDIIRPRFKDARIHFALNCASVGCPPLAKEAYQGDRLDQQLDEACRRALNDTRWVRLRGEVIEATKIFEWYQDDFIGEAGSVVAFIARCRIDGDELMKRAKGLKIRFTDYDWSLNRSR